MGVTVSIAVMTVVQRSPYVAELVDRLERQVSVARGQSYDVYGPAVTYDYARRGPWFNWVQAWATHAQFGSTHHAVLQDDVLPCADLPQTLVELVRARPHEFISCFQWPTRDWMQRRAHAQGIAWTSEVGFLGAQCVVLPVALGDRAVRWVASHERPEWKRTDDTRLNKFLRAMKRRAYIPVPFPVDHIGAEIGGSVHKPRVRTPPTGARARAELWRGDQTPLAGLPWRDGRCVG